MVDRTRPPSEDGAATGDGTAALPDDLATFLDGTTVQHKIGWTALLVTTDSDAAPHVALLSVGELLAVSPSTIRIALWPTSRTSANLTARRPALLVTAHDGGALKTRLTVRATGHLAGPPRRAWFETGIDAVALDRVPYARLVSLGVFQLESLTDVDRWRSTLRELASPKR